MPRDEFSSLIPGNQTLKQENSFFALLVKNRESIVFHVTKMAGAVAL
jgi:hypothetical protein